MNKYEIKRFVEDHKKELITGAVIIGGTVLVMLGCKGPIKNHVAKTSYRKKMKDIPIPDGLKVWNTSMLWVEDGYLNAIVENIPMDDLGELGKEYIKNGLAQPGEIASVIIGVEYKK